MTGEHWTSFRFIFRCTRNGHVYIHIQCIEHICRKNSIRKTIFMNNIFCERYSRVCLPAVSLVSICSRVVSLLFCVFSFSPHLSESKANVMRSESKLCAKDEYQLDSSSSPSSSSSSSSVFYILKWKSMHVLCEFDTICAATNKPLAVDILTHKRTQMRERARNFAFAPQLWISINSSSSIVISYLNLLSSEFGAAATNRCCC